MSIFEHIDLLSIPDPAITAAINGLDQLANPTQDTARRLDLEVLACSGTLIPAPRVVFATDNALMMFLLQTLPGSASQIVIGRLDFADASKRVVPNIASKITSNPENNAQTPTALVIDILDMDSHREQITRELRSGKVTQLWAHNSLLSFARDWFDHAGRELFEHFPFSRGFAGANLNAEQCRALADSIDACASESRWEPSKLHYEANRAAQLDLGSMRWLAKTIGQARDDQEFLLCGLSKRIGGLLDEIFDALNTAIPHFNLQPAPPEIAWTNRWKKDIITATERVINFLDEHPSKELFATMMTQQRTQALHSARLLIKNKSDIIPARTLRLSAQLIGMLFRIREQCWWMRHWDAPNNTTWELIRNTDCPAGTLVPKPVRPLQEYFNFYWYEGARNAARMKQGNPARPSTPPSKPSPPQPSRRRIRPLGELTHTTRKLQAAELCSLMLTRLGAQFPDETIRWLDVGCGDGGIANAVHIPDWLEDRVEIIGLDFGEGMINHANQNAAKGRRYMVTNALTPPEHLRSKRFHLISAFEFLEHLLDPVALLKDYLTLNPEIMVAGSPLGEPQSWLPGMQHTWTFHREGYEALFKGAGMEITYSSEVRIGSYLGGHDWLTVAGMNGAGIEKKLDQHIIHALHGQDTFEEYKPSPLRPAAARAE